MTLRIPASFEDCPPSRVIVADDYLSALAYAMASRLTLRPNALNAPDPDYIHIRDRWVNTQNATWRLSDEQIEAAQVALGAQ